MGTRNPKHEIARRLRAGPSGDYLVPLGSKQIRKGDKAGKTKRRALRFFSAFRSFEFVSKFETRLSRFWKSLLAAHFARSMRSFSGLTVFYSILNSLSSCMWRSDMAIERRKFAQARRLSRRARRPPYPRHRHRSPFVACAGKAKCRLPARRLEGRGIRLIFGRGI